MLYLSKCIITKKTDEKIIMHYILFNGNYSIWAMPHNNNSNL